MVPGGLIVLVDAQELERRLSLFDVGSTAEQGQRRLSIQNIKVNLSPVLLVCIPLGGWRIPTSDPHSGKKPVSTTVHTLSRVARYFRLAE